MIEESTITSPPHMCTQMITFTHLFHTHTHTLMHKHVQIQKELNLG